MTVHVLELKNITPMTWKNGGGQTYELLKWPPHSLDDWAVRISVATIDKDGPFSTFPSVDRWFAVLDGDGVKLDFAVNSPQSTQTHLQTQQLQTQQSDPLHFDGGLAPDCALLNGSTRDLNLMSQRGTSCMTMVKANRPFQIDADLRTLYCRAAGVWRSNTGDSVQLQAHSLLWVEGSDAQTQWTFEANDKSESALGFWLHYKAKAN